MSPQGGAGYQRLAGYVLNVKREHQPADPASWTRLNAYILDTEHQGEKVAWARATNCQTDDPGWAVKEILATQARNTRSRGDKSYHLVVSFPEGEKPTREQIEDIEDRLCAALGFDEHQRVSAVHQNTDNWHLHIAINKVHPRDLPEHRAVPGSLPAAGSLRRAGDQARADARAAHDGAGAGEGARPEGARAGRRTSRPSRAAILPALGSRGGTRRRCWRRATAARAGRSCTALRRATTWRSSRAARAW